MTKKRNQIQCKGASDKINQHPENFNFKTLAEKWPSSIVARSEIREFTGGLISPKTWANAECSGEGPKSFRFGKKRFAHVDDIIQWMNARQNRSASDEK